MERIEAAGIVDGASSLLGAITPVVVWKRSGDAELREMALNMLGGYVLFRRRPTRMERQAVVLQERLEQWRRENGRAGDSSVDGAAEVVGDS